MIQPPGSMGAAIGGAGNGGAETTCKAEVMSTIMKNREKVNIITTLRRYVGRRGGRFKPSLTGDCKPPGTSNRAVIETASATLVMENPSICDIPSDLPYCLGQATRGHCEEHVLSMRSFDGELIAALGQQTAGNGQTIKHDVAIEEKSCSGQRERASDAIGSLGSITSTSVRRLSSSSRCIDEVNEISQNFIPVALKTNYVLHATTPKLCTPPDESFGSSYSVATSLKPNAVSIQGDSDITPSTSVHNQRCRAVQNGVCADAPQLPSSPYCAPSLLSTIQLSTSPSLRVETDDDSILLFSSKVETPTHVSLTDIFGDDPPTPSAYFPELDCFSTFLSLTPSRQFCNDLHENYLANYVVETDFKQLQSDFADVSQLDPPEIVSSGVVIIPTTSQVSVGNCLGETGHSVPPLPSLLRFFDGHHLENRLPQPLSQKLYTRRELNSKQFGVQPLDHQMQIQLLERDRTQQTEQIKEQLLLRATVKHLRREQAARSIDESRCWRQVGHRGVLWPFARMRKQRETPMNMAFITLHVVAYSRNGRRLVETRVEHRHKIYVDSKEFICPVRRGRRGWIIVDPADRRENRNRLGWFQQMFINGKQEGKTHVGTK